MDVGRRLDEEMGKLLRLVVTGNEALNEQQASILRAYKMLAQCIQSEQLSPAQIEKEMLADPPFAAWYHKEFGHGLS